MEHPVIVCLDLRNNMITEEGARALLQVMRRQCLACDQTDPSESFSANNETKGNEEGKGKDGRGLRYSWKRRVNLLHRVRLDGNALVNESLPGYNADLLKMVGSITIL